MSTLNTENESNKLVRILNHLHSEMMPGSPTPKIVASTRLESELGIDSLARMELLQRLETEFHTTFDEESIINAETVHDLHEAITHVDQHSASLDLVAPLANKESRHQGFPDDAKTLVEALDWHRKTQGDSPFVYFYPGDIDQPEIITYQMLWENALYVAGGLRSLGVKPGDSVALMLPTSETFLYSFFAILAAGAVPVPVYPPQRMSQIEEHLKRQIKILDTAQAVLLITVEEGKQLGKVVKALLPNLMDVITLSDLPKPRSIETVKREPEDTAFMQFTSGSTGVPKGVVLSHANLLANVRSMGQALEVTSDDVFCSWLPLYHDMGLIGAFLGSMYHGFPLVLLPPLSFIARPHRWLQAISKHKATLSGAPNFAYEICAHKIQDKDIEGIDLSSLRFAFNGAEPVTHATLERFCERFEGHGFNRKAMSPVYGLAENSVGVSFPPSDRGPKTDFIEADTLHSQRKAVATTHTSANCLHIVACGYPLPGHDVRIINEQGAEIGEREVGMLQFRGPSATSGYFRNPQATAGLLQNDWLNSGDYAYLVDGEIYITGRSKDMIIRAGRNIYPYELEQAIGAIQGVQKGNVAVFGSTDKEHGTEKLVVLAETRERDDAKLDKIRAKINEISTEIVQLIPDDIVLAPLRTVLKTSSGKIRRVECRQMYEDDGIGKAKSITRQFISIGLRASVPYLKRIFKKAKNFLYVIYAWILFATMALLSWPLIVLLPRKLSVRVMKLILRPILFLLGNSYKTFGKQHIPKNQSCILVSNHASYLDVFSLGLSLPATFSFVAKAELKKSWFMRLVLEKMNTHFVERFNTQQSVADSQQILHGLKPGHSVVFFVEGTFTWAPGLRAFKMGAFLTAAKANLPIIPVAIKGTRSILRGADWTPKRGAIEVSFGPVIHPEGKEWADAIKLRDQAREFILAHCGEPDLSN